MKKTVYYEFVTRREYKFFSQKCQCLQKITKELKKCGLKVNSVEILGSYKNKIVTRQVIDGEKKPFDFDFNLNFDYSEIPTAYTNGLQQLKDDIRTNLDGLLKKEGFRQGKMSQSVITYDFLEDGKKKFSIDIAIIIKNTETGKWMRLQNKGNTYTLENRREDLDSSAEIEKIKTNGKWTDLRKKYLEYKNADEEDLPSCIIFKRAAKDLCNELFGEKQKSPAPKSDKSKPIPAVTKKTDAVEIICEKILSINKEKRPKRENRIKNFVKALNTWKKLKEITDKTKFDLYADSVFERLKKLSALKPSEIRNCKKIEWLK